MKEEDGLQHSPIQTIVTHEIYIGANVLILVVNSLTKSKPRSLDFEITSNDSSFDTSYILCIIERYTIQFNSTYSEIHFGCGLTQTRHITLNLFE